MQDWYFSKYSLQELNDFDYSTLIKNSFLVRKIVDTETKSYLCYKNKVLDKNGNVIAEEKTSCPILDTEKCLQILKDANLINWCNLEQDMLVYSNNNMCFAVQIVKDLGIFIEYEEDETMLDLTEKEKIELMYNNLKSLGLNIGTDFNCKKVYLKFKK